MVGKCYRPMTLSVVLRAADVPEQLAASSYSSKARRAVSTADAQAGTLAWCPRSKPTVGLSSIALLFINTEKARLLAAPTFRLNLAPGQQRNSAASRAAAPAWMAGAGAAETERLTAALAASKAASEAKRVARGVECAAWTARQQAWLLHQAAARDSCRPTLPQAWDAASLSVLQADVRADLPSTRAAALAALRRPDAEVGSASADFEAEADELSSKVGRLAFAASMWSNDVKARFCAMPSAGNIVTLAADEVRSAHQRFFTPLPRRATTPRAASGAPAPALRLVSCSSSRDTQLAFLNKEAKEAPRETPELVAA